jgi:hypothetical protein
LNVTHINLKDLFQPAPTFRLVRDFITVDAQPGTLETVIKQISSRLPGASRNNLRRIVALPASSSPRRI